MTDPKLTLVLATSGLAAVAMVTAAMLAGWRGWLALKRQELARVESGEAPSFGHAGTRIELADLKERIRKLEAIAAGVDL